MAAPSPGEELPKQYDHSAAQQRWYPFWEQHGYFHAEPDDREPYSIVIPPPNVTGALHLGHALNNTLQDIQIRQKRMQGRNTLWMPGTDHAGIATQAVVERRLHEEEGKTRHDLGREKLVERIWAWKDQYEARIISQLKQMGCSCDWERTRFTLDETCARAVRQTFFKLFKDGLIYRGKRLVNWDTFLQTAVSDDEVFHAEVQGNFWHYQYPVIDPQPGEPTHVTIATTRPETMLGDTAVAVHPDPAAALDKTEARLKEELATAPAKEKAGIQAEIDAIAARRETHLPQLEKLRDMARAGRKLNLPLLNREIPLVADEWAKPELGSGCVKITPAHDPNDYEVGLRQKLPMRNILNKDGTLNEEAGPYQGLSIMEARKKVVADLEAAGLMLEIEDRVIDLAHSDRSKTPIEPFLADQWFVKMGDRDDGKAGLAQTAMDAVRDGRVRIFPERYAKSYLDWLSEKRDWPVGRQLWWGHRIPVWSAPLNPHVAGSRVPEGMTNEKQIAQLHREGEAWEKKVRDWEAQGRLARTSREEKDVASAAIDDRSHWFYCIRDAADHELIDELEDRGYQQEEDVLDTWFSSALWPHSTLGWPEETPELNYYYPTSVLITSRDIITLWVARMVLTGLYNRGEVPFHEVFIHPKILDGDGETMSKSKGNGVDPLDVVQKFGADALRFALAYLTTETQDVKMPVEFECPHCGEKIGQTKKNRVLPRIKCKKCKQDFRTQWAEKPEDKALASGPVISERFEEARNFCNKLWNASRFAMLNLEGYTPAAVADADLAVEDRWLLSRLSTVTREVSAALDAYRYAEAARTLKDFAWDEFCSFYVEMAKTRLADDAQRPAAQRVLAHALDTLLRLLHPFIPFLTEEVWQRLKDFALQRGLDQPADAAESAMIASWPHADAARVDEQIEARFACFQGLLGGLREVRSAQQVPSKEKMNFAVRCRPQAAELAWPMEPYFDSMADARATAWGPDVQPPATSASFSFTSGGNSFEVFVDLAGLLDIPAEIAKQEKEREKLLGLITGKEKKLANANFVDKAPADVVQRERDGLVELQQQVAAIDAQLESLRQAK